MPFKRVLKEAILIFLPLWIVTAGITYFFYKKEANILGLEVEHKEIKIVDLQYEAIKNEIDHIVSNLLLLSRDFELHMLSREKSENSANLFKKEIMLFSDNLKSYDQVRFIDEKGMEIIRVNLKGQSSHLVPEEKLQSKADRYYFKNTLDLDRGYIYISPFDLNLEEGKIESPLKPVIRFGTPVFYKNGEKCGIIIVNYLGEKILKALKELAGQGTSMLTNMEGYWFLGPEPEDEWGFIFPERKDRRFSARFPEAWQTISGSELGQFYNKDGLFTFKTMKPLEETIRANPALKVNSENIRIHADPAFYSWKIISLVPHEKLHTGSGRLARRFAEGYGLLFLVMLFISWRFAYVVVQRKRWQEALQKSEASLCKAQQIAHLGNWEWDLVNDKVEWSQTLFNILGLDRDKHYAGFRTFFKRVHPHDRAYVRENFAKAIGNKEVLTVDHRVIMADSSKRIVVHDYGEIILNNKGWPVKMIGTIQDITEQKKAEEILRKNNLLLDAIKNAQERCILEGDNLPLFDELLASLLTLTNSEYGFIGEVCYSSEGLPCLKTDISRYLRGRENMKKIDEKNIGENLEFSNINSLCDTVIKSGQPLIVNDPPQGTLSEGHYPLNSFMGIPFYNNGKLIGMAGIANRCDGYSGDLLNFLEPFVHTCGNIIMAYRSHTERVEAEEKLRCARDELEARVEERTRELAIINEELMKSEEQFRQVVDKSPVPMVITDSGGNIEHFNRKFIDLFGWTTQDVRTPEEWWMAAYPDEKYRERVRLSWEKAVNEANIKNIEIAPQQWQLTCKNGDLRKVEFKMVPLSQNRNVIAMNDITARVEAELNMMESREKLRALALHLQNIREEERSLIARNIHDELGQILTVCKFDLSWIGTQLTKKQADLLIRVKESIKYMDSAIQFVKRIATELRPALLDDMGLMAAVEWQAKAFEKKTGIRCHIQFKPWSIILGKDLSTAVFRIFQEALTNVTRHSGADTVSVVLEGDGPNLVLEIKDNGKGISENDLRSSESYGIIGMKERVFPWGGSVEIYGEKGRGTTLKATIPLLRTEEKEREMKL